MKMLPIKSWCRDLDENAKTQAVHLAMHPVTFGHVALMPDCHMGYGMPIGGVIACEDAIIPNAVGVDIGCGMIALRTDIHMQNPFSYRTRLRRVIDDIKRQVPLGFGRHGSPQEWDGFAAIPPVPIIEKNMRVARESLGTLGGGNHFIEVQLDERDRVWLMVHSGSRNLGKQICDHFNQLAMERCTFEFAKYGGTLDDLCYLDAGSKLGMDYIDSMNFALAFAEENRNRIMRAAMRSILDEFGGVSFDEGFNIHHNFAALETHFGRRLWIHRKGATQAFDGQVGIIPGSMGTPSYIVEGRGNEQSFMSCSHGAGRRMGRNEATRRLTVEECEAAMGDVVHDHWSKIRKGRLKGQYDLGEAPGAYKNINTVIESQLDLIKPIVKLRPIAVVKG